MKDMSKFQIILTGIFAAFIFLGVLLFSVGRFGGENRNVELLVWGSLPVADFNAVAIKAGLEEMGIKLRYIKQNTATFETNFIEALALGRGPDLFFLSQDSILKHKDKLAPISYKTLSERDFKNSFIEEGELYLTKDGILGVPFIIDPLVMYWNRIIFSNAGIATPPQFWSDFYDIAPRLTLKDGALNIRQSAVALGEYGNISHATELMSTLIMQAGGKLSQNQNDIIMSTLLNKFESPIVPAHAALTFYTDFTNPLKLFYSWNRSLPSSKNAFIAGDLGVYIGHASEVQEIRSKNPNLNFDIAKIPQSKGASQILTFGNMKALAIPKASSNQGAATQAALYLVGGAPLTELMSITGLPPVRRDMLATLPADPYMSIFYESAIQARGWLQPDQIQTNALFKEMIESVTAGRRTITDSVQRTELEMDTLFKNLE